MWHQCYQEATGTMHCHCPTQMHIITRENNGYLDGSDVFHNRQQTKSFPHPNHHHTHTNTQPIGTHHYEYHLSIIQHHLELEGEEYHNFSLISHQTPSTMQKNLTSLLSFFVCMLPVASFAVSNKGSCDSIAVIGCGVLGTSLCKQILSCPDFDSKSGTSLL